MKKLLCALLVLCMVLTLLPATAFGAAADYSVSVTGTEDTFPYGATVINNCTAPNGVTCYLYVRVSIDEDFANLSLYGCAQITGTGSPTAVKYPLTKLLPDTKYYYSVQITDKEYYSEGYSVLAESPIITFTTAPAGGVAAADEIKEGSPLNITFAAEKIKYLRFNPTDPQIAKITITGNNAGDVKLFSVSDKDRVDWTQDGSQNNTGTVVTYQADSIVFDRDNYLRIESPKAETYTLTLTYATPGQIVVGDNSSIIHNNANFNLYYIKGYFCGVFTAPVSGSYSFTQSGGYWAELYDTDGERTASSYASPSTVQEDLYKGQKVLLRTVGSVNTVSIAKTADATVTATGSCGNNVNWSLDSTGAMNISGSGAMPDYSSASDSPFYQYRSQIKSILVGLGITHIGSNAFGGCSNAVRVSIPQTVTSIGDYAFTNLESLRYLEIPDGVTNVGAEAFRYCSKIKSLIIPDSVTTVGEQGFEGLGWLELLRIGKGLSNVTEPIFGQQYDLQYTYVDPANTIYSSDDNGVLYNKKQSTLIMYPTYRTAVDFTIPNTVKTIGKEAFYYVKYLESINIPNSVSTIEGMAFYNCDCLKSVTVPDSVTQDCFAFADCTGLKTANIEGSEIDSYMFSGCTGLQYAIVSPNIFLIGESAFKGCTSLRSVYFSGKAPTTVYEAGKVNDSGDLTESFPNTVNVYYRQGYTGFEDVQNNLWKGYTAKPWDGKTIIASSLSNGTLSLDYKLSDAAVTAATCTVVAAAYSGGRLVGIQTLTNQNTAALKTDGCTITVQVPSSLTNVTWKILLLDSNTACKPLTAAASGTISST